MTDTSKIKPSYLALSGGVGGAKLVLGLQTLLADVRHVDAALQVIVNTGDDFEHLGLPICPDIDTLLYTLSGTANPATGWGRRDETWQFMSTLETLGGATWFRLGDRDMATHVRRRDLLAAGHSLTQVTAELRQALQVPTSILPMADTPVRTHIQTATEELEFQDYFVRQQAQPIATGIRYAGAATTMAAPEALAALRSPSLQVIIVTPSNPWLSIAPILSLAEIKSTILASEAPVVGISPIIDGKAVKGPTAKLMHELGVPVSASGVAEYYGDLLDGFIIDTADASQQSAIEARGIAVTVTNTRMKTIEDKVELARSVLQLAEQLRNKQAAQP